MSKVVSVFVTLAFKIILLLKNIKLIFFRYLFYDYNII
jgi:hypothetical protein